MDSFVSALILFLGALPFLYRRTLRLMRYFQQEEYRTLRFCKWIFANRAYDTVASLIVAIGMVGIWFTSWKLISLICAAALVWRAFLEEDPRTLGKVTLKMTERATTLLVTTLAMVLSVGLLLLYFNSFVWLGLIALFQFMPWVLILANGLLWPQEMRKQTFYLTEAKKILADVSPYVIGITGSYGKTSTKDALGKILQVTLGPTFWPPKSINTPMGITREIRERLVKGYEYAIIEMGAYYRGSIQRLCDLTPPHAALVTGVGKAHLDRFGNEENVYLAKSELSQAVPREGLLVCNGDNAGAKRMAQAYPKKETYFYGFGENFDCTVSEWGISHEGTHFLLHWRGKSYTGLTPLLGKAALSNLLGAFTMACALGADPEFVLAVMRTLEPVDNRLQVRREGPITYLHDAYNSNPNGFICAIEVMKALPGKRRLCMTPGMIELGVQQEEENRKAAAFAAQNCDMAFVVGETNRKALVQGFQEGGIAPHNIFLCETREVAFDHVAKLRKEGDIILIENDLTDLYEAQVRF